MCLEDCLHLWNAMNLSQGLREKGVEVSYARQLKRNVTIDGVRTGTLLPVWVITVTKNPENIARLTGLTGILNFVIRIRDFKQKGNQGIQCFRCQGFGHKADFSLWSPLHSPLSSLLGPNTRLRILFSNTLSLDSSLNVRDHVSQPYSTTGNIIVLYILIFKFLERRLKCLD